MAEQDLAELYDYVAIESGVDRAHAAILLLARMPGMGHWREDLPPSLRAWAVHRWLVLYRPGTVPLEVVRIVGGWQDVSSRLESSDFD